jgi:carbamoyltransferase
VPNLCLAGGVALNAVANGLIRSRTPFENFYIQPAAGDSGTAIGAAYFVWNGELGQPRSFVMDHAYFGPQYSDDVIGKALEKAGLTSRRLDDEELVGFTADHIAAGEVVGWFQGRMEFGPRALGNRSIVADPRRHDMKDVLNARIKHRESFRPFAPSVLAEAAADWYEDGHESPFMIVVFNSREGRRELIPAVDHVDGTGRVQTVTREANPRYYSLIQAFAERTDTPVVLNTSFNENEPIVCTPEEAIACFTKTSMDVLVLGNHVVERSS